MLIATSSGLAVATVFEEQSNDQSPPLFAIATKPHTLLQYAYTIFGVIVVCLLVTSILLEVRRKRFLQMAYGGGLLIIMVGLWYVHSILTTGAVIV
jgi:protein-S-isoprenylcysteine O-methyltransferase Ste14